MPRRQTVAGCTHFLPINHQSPVFSLPQQTNCDYSRFLTHGVLTHPCTNTPAGNAPLPCKSPINKLAAPPLGLRACTLAKLLTGASSSFAECVMQEVLDSYGTLELIKTPPRKTWDLTFPPYASRLLEARINKGESASALFWRVRERLRQVSPIFQHTHTHQCLAMPIAHPGDESDDLMSPTMQPMQPTMDPKEESK